MELVLVDASVAAKWVLTEPETGAALELLRGTIRCAAPSIVKLEVAGAVVRRLRTGLLTPTDARAACDDWRDLIEEAFVQLIPTEELYDAAVELALSLPHGLADCLYLAAARKLDCPLLTADRALYERAQAVHEHVTLLAKAA